MISINVLLQDLAKIITDFQVLSYDGNLNAVEAKAGSSVETNGRSKSENHPDIQDDGFVFVIDKVKDLIRWKAHKFSPSELESYLLSHPEIVNAAVIPFSDKEIGQYPMAYVVRKDGSEISESAITDFIDKKGVAPFKRIRRVEFVPSLPKNSSGKISKKDLIKLALSKL